MTYVQEEARRTPVIEDVDVCVVGGSATGVFAAVRAARLGARVALVEMANCFGGSATLSMVNHWHRIHDIHGEEQIIDGLSTDVVSRLDALGAVDFDVNDRTWACYNTEAMKLALDDIVAEHQRIVAFLHTQFAEPIMEDDSITGVAVQGKSGRGIILARAFVDASGDGDLAARSGVPFTASADRMPGTTCAKIEGLPPKSEWNLSDAIREHREEFGIREDYGWYGEIPGSNHVTLHFDLHVFNFDATDTRSLTQAEIRGRRQVRAVLDLIDAYAPRGTRVALIDLPAKVGVRESRHFSCMHRTTGDELLAGVRFPDAIGTGIYPPDLHNAQDGSTHLKFLDGTEIRSSFAARRVRGRWRAEGTPSPPYYQFPLRSLIPAAVTNLVIAGRAIDADQWAHGALRVMINCNQTGEAAGVAAALCANSDTPIQQVNAEQVRKQLVEGGSSPAILDRTRVAP